jgi:peptide/nickel transport system permease protein
MLTQYIVRRLVLLIPVLIGISLITFILIRLIPGDIVTQMMGVTAGNDPQIRARILHELGLDLSVPEQYLRWMGKVVTGDFGYSFIHGGPVLEEIGRRYPVTVELTALSMIIAVLMGVPLGILSATRRGAAVDYLGRILSLVGISAPNFFVGTLIVVLGAIYFPSVKTMGYVSLQEDPVQNISRMIWPALALGLAVAAIVLRYTRSSMLEALSEDYVRTARAKGLANRVVFYRHVLRNALIPLITTIGVQLSFLLGGTVILEEVFAIPGLGRLVLGSINQRDYPMIQGAVLFFAINVVVVMLVVDILCSLADPRVRLE